MLKYCWKRRKAPRSIGEASRGTPRIAPGTGLCSPQGSCWARLLAFQALHAVYWLGAATAGCSCFLGAGHSLPAHQDAGQSLSTVENSQKSSTSYGNGFGKIFIKCICCTDVDWSLPPEKLWEEGAGSNPNLHLVFTLTQLRMRFLLSIFCSSTQIIFPILRHGNNKSTGCHPVVMCPRSYVPWHFLCSLILPASVARAPLMGQRAAANQGKNCYKYLLLPVGGIRISSVDQNWFIKRGEEWCSCLPTASIIAVQVLLLLRSHKPIDV